MHLSEILGDGFRMQEVCGRRVFVYTNAIGKSIVLLCKNITYLGNPHPILKKRIQLSTWYKGFSLTNEDMDVRYIGVYHYAGLLVFVDFDKSKYLAGKSHNSSAHVYTNDLYQALINKFFRKTDANGNLITVVSLRGFKSYLDGNVEKNEIFRAFDLFNDSFCWDVWIPAESAIKVMYNNKWSQWRQVEWAGWFLEYMVSSFVKKEQLDNVLVYTGLSNKFDSSLDFDLYFPTRQFQGDLKASDISKSETPGNDQDALLESINRYGRFWYVIYEHETIKDKDVEGNPATKSRNRFLYEVDGVEKSPMSYLSRMKHSVYFKKMMIVEINRINSHQLLKLFNQGHQQDGSQRKPKFNINKKGKDFENFVVYRYEKT